MVLPHGSGDLYHKYRPRRFSEVAGHKDVINSIRKALSIEQPSQVFLLTGDSGTGKTTTARIMALSLNCLQPEEGEPCLSCKPCKTILAGNCIDIIEKNAAEHRGIDAVREISSSMSLMPMYVKSKVYILDEFHQMTKEAQSSLLKVLEEVPQNVFIILCTTHPTKILPTVRNRCQQFKFSPLSRKTLISLMEEIATYETVQLDQQIFETIADNAKGSPRQALVFLQQAVQLDTPTATQVKKLISVDEEDKDIIELAFSLNSKTNWADLMTTYSEVKEAGAPAIGMIIAGFFRNRLIGSKTKLEAEKNAQILELFVVPFDDGKLGENQLVLSLFKAVNILRAS